MIGDAPSGPARRRRTAVERVARSKRAHAAHARRMRAQAPAARGILPTPRSMVAPVSWQGSLLTTALTVYEALKGVIGWIAFHLTPRPARVLPLRSPDEFWFVGHRGAAAFEVENTLPSLTRALAEGANAVEIDCCMTQDGHVVLWHDWDPDDRVAYARQAGGELDVRCRPVVPPEGDPLRRTVDRLALPELRAHYGYAELEARETLRAHIPLLEEVVAWAAAQGERLKGVYVDLKIPPARLDLVEPFVAILRAALARERPRATFVVATLFEEVLLELRRLAPEIDRALDVEIQPGLPHDEADHAYSAVRPALRHGSSHASFGRPKFTFFGWGVYVRALRSDLTLLAHHDATRSGPMPRLLCWTLNRPREVRRLLRMGVHGIVTDAPALVRREHAAQWQQQRT